MAKEKDRSPARPAYVLALFGKAIPFMQRNDFGASGAANPDEKQAGAGSLSMRLRTPEARRGLYTPVAGVAAACNDPLDKLLASDASIRMVGACTVEGYEIAYAAREPIENLTRLFVIASSLATLGGAVSGELKIGEFNNLIVCSAPSAPV